MLRIQVYEWGTSGSRLSEWLLRPEAIAAIACLSPTLYDDGSLMMPARLIVHLVGQAVPLEVRHPDSIARLLALEMRPVG